jgi:hypothetical protein
MSWLYSQALVAEFSADDCSAGEPSAQLNETAMPLRSWLRAKTTAAFTLSQSGTTFAPLTESRGEAVLMSFLAAFPARTCRLQARAPGSPESVQDSGESSPASFAKWSPATSSWKTPQLSLIEGLTSCSVTWPRWGMMRGGECLELTRPPSRLTAEKSRSSTTETESGSWVIDRAPTLTVDGNYNRRGLSPTSGDGLATWIRERLPTLTAGDAVRGDCPSERERNSPSLVSAAADTPDGGPLNPPWCEWFMGCPIGWTALGVSATRRFRQWLHSHGAS